MNPHVQELLARYPALEPCAPSIESAIQLLATTFHQGGKLLTCGNGGSASDAEHIVGELMKGFLLKRPIPQPERTRLTELSGEDLGAHLQGALPAIALTSQLALNTAVANDNRPDMIFAQQIYGLGKPGDSLLGISTSGNSANVLTAFHVAKLKGLTTIALTGASGGKLAPLADVAIRVPADKVIPIQEYHLPIYHTLCVALEAEFFS